MRCAPATATSNVIRKRESMVSTFTSPDPTFIGPADWSTSGNADLLDHGVDRYTLDEHVSPHLPTHARAAQSLSPADRRASTWATNACSSGEELPFFQIRLNGSRTVISPTGS